MPVRLDRGPPGRTRGGPGAGRTLRVSAARTDLHLLSLPGVTQTQRSTRHAALHPGTGLPEVASPAPGRKAGLRAAVPGPRGPLTTGRAGPVGNKGHRCRPRQPASRLRTAAREPATAPRCPTSAGGGASSRGGRWRTAPPCPSPAGADPPTLRQGHAWGRGTAGSLLRSRHQRHCGSPLGGFSPGVPSSKGGQHHCH